jgi:hypothetical protein
MLELTCLATRERCVSSGQPLCVTTTGAAYCMRRGAQATCTLQIEMALRVLCASLMQQDLQHMPPRKHDVNAEPLEAGSLSQARPQRHNLETPYHGLKLFILTLR